MTRREEWRDFICAPERAGRHLSTIGRGVTGAASDAIDLAVLQMFLERLRNATDDIRLLGDAVHLTTGGFIQFAKGALPKLLSSLSNEMLSEEDIVGPALSGQPRWDRTLIQRLSGSLPPTYYVSRTSHRSFDLPENQLIAWLVNHIHITVADIETRVGTTGLHPDLQILRKNCSRALEHDWLSDVPKPTRLSRQMLNAGRLHRSPHYRQAAVLAESRVDMTAADQKARWYSILSLLAVNWLEPVNEDDFFELYVLILVIDILSIELKFGEPIEYGLVTRKRGPVATFESGTTKLKVYFDQTAAAVLRIPTEIASVFAYHNGISGSARRPDIILVFDNGAQTRTVLVEMKKSTDGTYLSDSIYKMFAYLYDFQSANRGGDRLKAILAVPEGISAIPAAPSDRTLFIASGSDRLAMANALRNTLLT